MKKFLISIIGLFFLTAIYTSAEQLPVFSAPFEIVDNRPFVVVKIKDKSFHFVIDTGGYNSIDTEIAGELNFDLRNKFQIQGAGEKKVDAWTTVVDSFEIGDKKFASRKFYVLPLKEIKEALKLPYLDGIIGYDFFGESILQIDYPNKKVSFLTKFDGKNGIPFSIYGSHIPQFAVEIDGIKSDLILDTGDRSQLTLGQKFYEQVLAKNQYKLSEKKATGYGLGGTIMAQIFELKSLKFGTVEATRVVTRIPDEKSGGFSRSNFMGSVGSGLLKNYKITLDYKDKVLFVE